MLTYATRESTCQGPSCYSEGACGQGRWPIKPIAISIDMQGCGAANGVARAPRRAEVWWRWGFFSCPLFLSRSWFSCQALKNLVVLHFEFVLDLDLILLIFICFDFNAFRNLFFSI
jgi:hypothetical protein